MKSDLGVSSSYFQGRSEGWLWQLGNVGSNLTFPFTSGIILELQLSGSPCTPLGNEGQG